MKWKEFTQIALAGLIGGFLAYLLTIYSLPADARELELIPAATYILAGGFASLVGVYLLANTDRNELGRCLAFALCCGLMWKPIVTTAQRLVLEQTGKTAEARLEENTRRLATTPIQEKPAVINAVVRDATTLITHPNVAWSRPGGRSERSAAMEQAVRSLSVIRAERNPELSRQAEAGLLAIYSSNNAGQVLPLGTQIQLRELFETKVPKPPLSIGDPSPLSTTPPSSITLAPTPTPTPSPSPKTSP